MAQEPTETPEVYKADVYKLLETAAAAKVDLLSEQQVRTLCAELLAEKWDMEAWAPEEPQEIERTHIIHVRPRPTTDKLQ